MKSHTRLPLAIALTSAMAFAVGCGNSNEDRTAMQPADEAPAAVTPPPAEPVATDPALQGNDALYSADASRSDQPVDDTWITTKVKSSLLADSDVSGLDINVETVNGVVTLSGQVDQQAQIEHATNIARGIEGVTDVRTTELVSR
ncbi:MAG: BON domain-containing protein [Luteimonas sp.]|nr:BON domain-containing protein [Luteimonas sp.]